VTAKLVMDALLMAVFRWGSPWAVLHHSDLGSQYASEYFQRLLESHGIVCRMIRRGNGWTTPTWRASSQYSKPNA